MDNPTDAELLEDSEEFDLKARETTERDAKED